MPLPLILGGIAIASGATGLGGIVNGGLKLKKAEKRQKLTNQRHQENVQRVEAQNKTTIEALERLGEKELEILESFQHFSDLFEQVKNRPIFKDFQKEHVQIPTYDAEELKKVSIGAGVLLGGLGGAALGTAGGFAAAGAATAAVMALGTASTGTAIASLSGAAATNAALAALGGGAIAAGGGGIALGTAVLGGATAGVALLIGGVIFSLSGKKLSDKAEEAWKQVEQEETEINKICAYLEKIHNAGTMLTVSLDAVNRKYQQHMKLLEDLVVTQGRTEWNTYTKAEKYLTENTVLLVNLLYQMCKVQLVQKIEGEDQINQVNEEAVKQTVNDATAVLRSL